MEPRIYRDADANQLARLMNIACLHKRYYVPVNAKILRDRLGRISRNTRARLFVLDDGIRFIGACHVFYDYELEIGSIAYLLSLPGEESDVWPVLLSTAMQWFPNGRFVSMGSPYTPVYQSLEGRIQPLWGSTESMEIHSEDVLLLDFLTKNGFTAQEYYYTMCKPLPIDSSVENTFELLRGEECWYNGYSWHGNTSAEEFGLRNRELSVLLQKKDGLIEGHVAWYPLHVQNKAALCDLEVACKARRQGIGRALLRAAFYHMSQAGYTSCELFLCPSQSPNALRLYVSEGFIVEHVWYELRYHKKN